MNKRQMNKRQVNKRQINVRQMDKSQMSRRYISKVASILILGILVMTLLLPGCKKKQSDGEAFDELAQKMAIETLEASPVTATFTLGDLKAYNIEHLASELDHIDLSKLEEDLESTKKELKELEAIDKEKLTSDQRKTYELLEFQLDYGIDMYDFIYMENLIQPSSGIHIDFPLALMQIEFEEKSEIDAFVKRVSELPRLFDEVIVYEEERASMGYTLPAYLYGDVVEQMDNMLVEPENFMMYLSFVDRVDSFESLSDEERDTYKKEYLTLITDEVYPAFLRLKEETLKLQEASSADGSISEWDLGKDYYESVVAYKTSNELDVEELREWADNQMTDVVSKFQKILTDNPELLSVDLMAMLPKYSTMDEIYALVNQISEEQFKDYGVESASEHIIPTYLEENLPPGFYFPVTVDGEDYGNMFLQQSTYDELTADTLVLFYHENIPGHHLYYSYIAKSEEPLVRKMSSYLPYEEGWATYIQGLAFDYMGLEDGIGEFLAINSAYSNAFMVLLDIKLHYDGLSVEEVKNEFVNLGYDQETIDSIVDRMICKPGEMIHYMYGEYKMNEFKQRFIDEQGDKFDPKKFHDFILSNFGLPFFIVEEAMDEYFE